MIRDMQSWRCGLLFALLGLLSGCTRADNGTWYGYYYENVMVNQAPAVSRPFGSAPACLASMRNYTRNASRWAGFACARGCSQLQTGFVTDCEAVAR